MLPHISAAQARRFWSHINRDNAKGCWPWYGAVNKQTRYGEFEPMSNGVKSRFAAHRVAWALFNGEPGPNVLILHTCDNRACCNPAHLYPGTHADNTRDMLARGRANPSAWVALGDRMRGRKGAAHPAALPDHDERKARAIRLYQEHHTYKQIATELGVCAQTVGRWWNEHVAAKAR